MKIDPFPGQLTKQMVDCPSFRKKSGKHHTAKIMKWVLTDEQREWFCKWFPEEENSRLMKASGMSHTTLHMFARKYGLTKSAKGIKRIKHRQALHVKRLCERNGYYDSIRGRQPSEACKEATRKRWRDYREGKCESPQAIMKRKHPRKYKEMTKRMSENRKELFRKERRKLMYGIQRETKLKGIVLNPYTRSQICRRYNALQRGYIIMEDCSEQSGERYNIYFDSSTQRSTIFERNLAKDGFNILPWVEKVETTNKEDDDEEI